MEKIKKLKNKLKKYSLDGYLIPKNDEYFSEYVPLQRDYLQYISNFSGSYGLALILKKNNFLLVDGRYTVQANIQSGRNFEVLTLPINKNKKILKLKNKRIGFDPKLFTEPFIEQFSKKLDTKCIAINNNLVGFIKNKKNNIIKKKKFYVLDKSITGENSLHKIRNLKKYFFKNNIDVMLITSTENIAWLLNIRGFDSEYSPIPT